MARGLCATCYQREWYRTKHGSRGFVPCPQAACHPERKHYAQGKCEECYRRSYYLEHEGVKHARRRRLKTDEEIRANKNARARDQNKTPEVRAYFANRMRKWRAENPDRRLEKERAYRARNPDKVVSMHQRRRARLLDGSSPGVTPEQWCTALEHAGHACTYCGARGVKLTRDHVIPLSRGGRDEIANITPACRSCNSVKSNRTADEFLVHLEALARVGQVPQQFRRAG